MASQFAILHSKSPQVQLPCLSSTRISATFSRNMAMVPQPLVQQLSFSSSSSSIEISGCRFFHFPRNSFGNVQLRRNVAVKSHLPLVSPDDQWGNLAVLFSAGALGIWSEETKIGSALSGALVSILLGLAASNFGIIASDASAFPIVMEFLLPLAVPLLLFRAHLRHVIKSTWTILLAFLLGSVGTTIGTSVAYSLVPMRTLGRDSWKIAAALMGMRIGGAFNYVGISDFFDISSSAFAAGLAVDKVICALYFATLFTLASKELPETTRRNVLCRVDVEKDTETEYNNKLLVLQAATSLAVSFAICKIGSYMTKYFEIPGGSIPAITIVIVVVTAIFPKSFAYLAPSAEAIAMFIMQVFFVVVGARVNIWSVVNTAPSIFVFSLVQTAVHLAITIGLGKLLHFDMKSLLIASNANIVDPTTACVMAANKGWSSMTIPVILVGFLGRAIATFPSIVLGLILKYI